jgi:hypothetical protein
LIIIEHNPLLFEDAVELTEYVYQSMRDAAKEAEVLLYSFGPIFPKGKLLHID